MIGLLDIGMGNLRSVYNAVYTLGFDIETLDSASGLDDVSHLIIPGVGSFHSAMTVLESRGLKDPLRSFSVSGRPLLGLCLGMQLLADHGVEGGGAQGLGLIPGQVTKLSVSPDLRLPHVGWNTISIAREHPVFERVKRNVDCYFVHSYHLNCETQEHCLARTDYGPEFVSIAGNGNVLGFQFHPEKSQATGLLLLENFCRWDGIC